MNALTIAERLARTAHAGQREKLTGDDYIKHVERVVARVEGDVAKTVAWLHDVLEDTPLTVDDLKAAGISDTVIDDVRVLTRPRGVHDGYDGYVRTVLAEGSAVAKQVKMADIRDHLRPMKNAVLHPGMRKRYERALQLLRSGGGIE